MKVIYIAGPYRARTVVGVGLNILRARRAALFVWTHGGAALCPHLNTAFFDGHAPDAVWLEGDMAMLRRCDAAWFIRGWWDSLGANAELMEAGRVGVPRLFSREGVVAFLSESCESPDRP